MSYSRISAFPPSDQYKSNELQALAAVWRERKDKLSQNGAYQEFLKKLQREWAIETGIIERLYTWDRGVTETLIEQGIDASIIAHKGRLSAGDAENVQALIKDHLAIVESLFGYVKGETPFTEHFIRQLHAQFTAHQHHTDAITPTGNFIEVSLLKGKYKEQPNNPRRADGEMHFYCPPELTQEEMENLVRMYRAAENDYPPEIKAAWLQHRFTQIHPFQDGNGRVARALASLVFLREGLFPLVIRESDRNVYFDALESGDAGDLEPLVMLFARRQSESILKALGLEQQVQQSKHADQIISSALELLRNRKSRKQEEVQVVYTHAGQLFDKLVQRFDGLEKSLTTQLSSLTPAISRSKYNARSNSASNTANDRHYFHKQLVDVANRFDYFANFDRYRSWARLTLKTDQEFDYVVSLHGFGPGETGILVASAFTYLKVPREEGGTESMAPHPACTDFFQFNYAEPFDSTQKRFDEWMESSLAIALAEWRRSLQMGM